MDELNINFHIKENELIEKVKSKLENGNRILVRCYTSETGDDVATDLELHIYSGDEYITDMTVLSIQEKLEDWNRQLAAHRKYMERFKLNLLNQLLKNEIQVEIGSDYVD